MSISSLGIARTEAGLKRLGLGTLAQAYGPDGKKNSESVNFIDILNRVPVGPTAG